VFVWPTREQRWSHLSTATLKAAPGSQASYSNLAFDLLADALERPWETLSAAV
jgi:D-alanyl-D-alanine-carboxypeptidase/D-alanyl-D-alanine-endopeptidase